MIKTVRYLKGGRIKKMAKVYADILVKLGLVVYIDDSKDFRNEIVQTVVKQSPVIKDEITTFISKPKAVATKPKAVATKPKAVATKPKPAKSEVKTK